MMNKANYGHRRPQDDIPYEYRMKYIIEAYRKDLEKIDYLVEYVKKLKQELDDERKKRSVFAMKNQNLIKVNTYRNRQRKRMYVHLQYIIEKYQLPIAELPAYNDDSEQDDPSLAEKLNL